MSWQCYLVTEVPGRDFVFDVPGEGLQTYSMLRPGAMWFDDGDPDDLVVKLPSGSEWYIDRGRVLNEQTTGNDVCLTTCVKLSEFFGKPITEIWEKP